MYGKGEYIEVAITITRIRYKFYKNSWMLVEENAHVCFLAEKKTTLWLSLTNIKLLKINTPTVYDSISEKIASLSR